MSERRLLPQKRRSDTVKVKAGRLSIFITIGYFDDGTPGEIFIDTAKAGSELKEMYMAFGLMASVALQHGASLQSIVHMLEDFSPHGVPRIVGDALAAESRRIFGKPAVERGE